MASHPRWLPGWQADAPAQAIWPCLVLVFPCRSLFKSHSCNREIACLGAFRPPCTAGCNPTKLCCPCFHHVNLGAHSRRGLPQLPSHKAWSHTPARHSAQLAAGTVVTEQQSSGFLWVSLPFFRLQLSSGLGGQQAHRGKPGASPRALLAGSAKRGGLRQLQPRQRATQRAPHPAARRAAGCAESLQARQGGQHCKVFRR